MGSSRTIDQRTRTPEFHVGITLCGGRRITAEVIELLEAVGSEGSITQAAKKRSVSYRWAWVTIQAVNQSFAQAAVTTPKHRMGGNPAQLTHYGRELIVRFRELEQNTRRAGALVLKQLDEMHSG